MGFELDLTVAGTLSPSEAAAIAMPHDVLAFEPGHNGRYITADFRAPLGCSLTIMAGTKGYKYTVGTDDAAHLWQPEHYVDLNFDIHDDDADRGVEGAMTVVARVLASTTEDLTLVMQSDYLLLSRFDGVVVRHRPTWWEGYPQAGALLPA